MTILNNLIEKQCVTKTTLYQTSFFTTAYSVGQTTFYLKKTEQKTSYHIMPKDFIPNDKIPNNVSKATYLIKNNDILRHKKQRQLST